MTGQMDGKVALVTGGASGFGRAIVRKCIQGGGRAAIADLDDENGKKFEQEITKEFGNNVVCFVHMDVSKREDWEKALKTILDRFGHLDVCVNNAGYAMVGTPAEDVAEAVYRKTYTVNLDSMYWATKVVLPYWLSAKPPATSKDGKWDRCFVNISSMSAMRPRPGLTWYASSKAAVITATKTLALELGPKGIRANAILPVASITPLFEGSLGSVFGESGREESLEKIKAGIPLGRFAEHSDIANAACFLAGNEATANYPKRCFLNKTASHVHKGYRKKNQSLIGYIYFYFYHLSGYCGCTSFSSSKPR